MLSHPNDDIVAAPLSLTAVWILAGLAAAFLCVGLAIAGLSSTGNTGLPVVLVIGLGVAEVSLFAWRRRRWMPSFHVLGVSTQGQGYRWSVGLWVTGYFCLLFAIAIVTGIAPGVGLQASALLGIPFAVLLVRSDQASANLGQRLLRATKLDADQADEEVGSLVGVVGGTLHYLRKHQMHVKDVQGTRIDGQGQAFAATTTTVKFPWTENATANGASLRNGDTSLPLELADARWASSDAWLTYESPSPERQAAIAKLATDKERRFAIKVERHGKQIIEARAASGDSMFALGRVRRVDGPAFEAAGPDGLLLFTSPAGTAPRRVLANHLGRHYLGLGGLLVVLVARLYLAAWLG